MSSKNHLSNTTQNAFFSSHKTTATQLKLTLLLFVLSVLILKLNTQFPPPIHQTGLFLTQSIFLTFALFISIGRLFRNAITHFRQLRFCLELPLLMSIILIYIYNIYLYFYAPEVAPVYSVALLAQLVILQFAYHKLDDKIFENDAPQHHFGQFLPRYSTLIKEKKKIQIPPEHLNKNDEILVHPAERFGADGIVVSGETTVSEDLFHHQATPTPKTPGSPVLAGTLNQESPVIVKVTQTFPHHTLAERFQLILKKNDAKKHYFKQHAGIVPWFEFFVLITAAATLCWWLPLNSTKAFDHAIMVLLLSCPCAIGLTKTSLLFYTKKACYQNGIFIKNPRSLIQLAKINHLLIEPIHFLTSGKLSVTDFHLTESRRSYREIWESLYALHQHCEHPVAQAICQKAKKMGISDTTLPVESIHHSPEKGIKGVINGKQILVGTARWLRKNGVFIPINEIERLEHDFSNNLALYHLHCAINGMEVARFKLTDTLKPGAQEIISELQKNHVTCHLFTNQTPNKTAVLAKLLNLKTHTKKTHAPHTEVLSFQNQGNAVAVAGKGLHLSLAMSCANVAISYNHAPSLTTALSDIIITKPGLSWLPFCLSLSQKTLKRLRQNILLCNLYYCLLLPMAIMGLTTPTQAILYISFGGTMVLANNYLWYLKLRKGLSDNPFLASEMVTAT